MSLLDMIICILASLIHYMKSLPSTVHSLQLAPSHESIEMHWAVNNILMDYITTLLDLTRESDPKNPPT